MTYNNNKLIQVYREIATDKLIVVFRHVTSKALGSHTIQAMDFNYKGILIKENSLTIYYQHIKPTMLTKEQQKQFNYILLGA